MLEHNFLTKSQDYAGIIRQGLSRGTDLQSCLPAIGDTLKQWDLTVNSAKTEFTHIERFSDCIAEEWRLTRKLGSLLGDREDIIISAYAAGHRCISTALGTVGEGLAGEREQTCQAIQRIYHTNTPVQLLNMGSPKQCHQAIGSIPQTSIANSRRDQLPSSHQK